MKLEDRFEEIHQAFINDKFIATDLIKEQCVEISNAETIGFNDWLTNENSKYSVMYGNQKERFADEEREYTIEQLLKIYQSEKQ